MTATVHIRSKQPWLVEAPSDENPAGVHGGLIVGVDVTDQHGMRSGTLYLDLPADAADDEISATVLWLYGIEPQGT